MSLTIRTSWDLSPLLAEGDNAPSLPKLKEEVRQAVEAFAKHWRTHDFTADVQTLRQALDQYEALQREHGTSGSFGYYFDLRLSQAQQDPVVKTGYNQSHELRSELGTALQFFELTLSTLPLEQLQSFAQHPQLAPYRHFLERLAAEAPFVLSEAEERILTLKSLPAHTSWVQLTSQLLSGHSRETELEDGSRGLQTFDELGSLLQSKNKAVRDEAVGHINAILAATKEVAVAETNAILANKKSSDELRGMKRPEIGRHLSDDIETETVDLLIKSVKSRYDISKRYYALKARLLGQDNLAYHERNVTYGELPGDYPFEKAAELVHSVMSQLDPQFSHILEGFLANGHIDVFPTQGKRGGAFCAGEGLSHPTYILLNHTNRLNDVLTLAHEVGHGINNELIKTKQHELYYATPLSTAEVASTFMEDFVLEDLLKDADAPGRLAILMMKLNDEVSTIFRQVACYSFEQKLHAQFREKSYLSDQEIGGLFQQEMSAYMGEAVEQSPGSEHWWIHWSHIRSFFYVYSYANGLLISKALQARYKADHAFIANIKEFLSAGTSKAPTELFADLGIDITDPSFWQSGLTEVEDHLNEAERLASSLNLLG